MKTLIYFFATAILSYIIAMGGLLSGRSTDMVINNILAYGVWGMFLWHVHGVSKRREQQRQWQDHIYRQRRRFNK